jgi:hypothetical protein
MAKINFKDISTSGFDEDALTTTTSGERKSAVGTSQSLRHVRTESAKRA